MARVESPASMPQVTPHVDGWVSRTLDRLAAWWGRPSRGWWLSALAAWAVLLAGMWAASGTLVPLNLTSGYTMFDAECNYLFNVDHFLWKSVFNLVDGQDPSTWQGSIVLRRVLYFVIAYPEMKWLGFERGGILNNFILTSLTAAIFVIFLRKRFGEAASIAGMWLLATYPGIAYWSGLPEGYAFIVPACLIIGIMLWYMNESNNPRTILLLALGIGIVFLGYDLLAIFVPAALFILVVRARFRLIVPALACLIAPQVLIVYLLYILRGVPIANDNTEIYVIVLQSYLGPKDMQAWSALINDLPNVLVNNFFYAGFLFIPILFALLLIVGAFKRQWLSTVEVGILLGLAAVWLFNNAAPPYPGWQIRGTWIARLYQPIFLPMVLFIVRWVQRVADSGSAPVLRYGTIGAITIAVAANGLTVFGPLLGTPGVSAILYSKFYTHGLPEQVYKNLELYGRHPANLLCVPDSSRWIKSW